MSDDPYIQENYKLSEALGRRKKQVNRLQWEREALERLLKRETGWNDEELSHELRRELELITI